MAGPALILGTSARPAILDPAAPHQVVHVSDLDRVLVLPDSGDRYLDTVYSGAWVIEKFGAVSHLREQRNAFGPVSAIEGQYGFRDNGGTI